LRAIGASAPGAVFSSWPDRIGERESRRPSSPPESYAAGVAHHWNPGFWHQRDICGT
jgi:hypothetical protein